MAAALLGQLLAVSHEAAVPHFRCAEHGDLTHVAITGTEAALSPSPDRLGPNQAQASDGHEHCAAAFTVRGGARPVVGRTLVRYAPPPIVRGATRSIVELPGRLFVLASARQTTASVRARPIRARAA
jgi:hypothetical protein